LLTPICGVSFTARCKIRREVALTVKSISFNILDKCLGMTLAFLNRDGSISPNPLVDVPNELRDFLVTV
jgi:hypothetical protein